MLDRRLGPEKNVGLLLPPSVAGALANVALALRGRVPVNLNYTAGNDHVNAAIRKSGIGRVVTSRRLLERSGIKPNAETLDLDVLAPSVTTFDKLWAAFVSRTVPLSHLGRFLPGLHQDRLDATATILFTSGTTGEPKGVVLSNRNILSNIRQVELQLQPMPEEVVLGILPFFHAMGHTVNLWATLCLGRRAVYHSNPLEAQIVGDLCQRHGVTLIFATPTFLRLYLRRCRREQFATVRRVALGAEKLSPELAEDIRTKLGIEPLEGYGCTELSPVVAFNVDHEIPASDGRPISGNREGTVGRPLPGTRVKTIDPDSQADLPSGSEGMICVKGPQVMVGYLDQPEQTAEAVVDGWYLTGDIGRIDEDGFLIIGGRLSRFSKIGGEMVPHERVEEALRTAAGVDDRTLVVTSVPDPRRGERLVVLYSDLAGKKPEDVTRSLITQGTPKLWIPSAEDFMKVEAIPLLGNGKLDLGLLRRIALERSHS